MKYEKNRKNLPNNYKYGNISENTISGMEIFQKVEQGIALQLASWLPNLAQCNGHSGYFESLI